jgi:hypothetical protein
VGLTFKNCLLESFQIEFERAKKAEGKKARGEKDKVMEQVFAAFEKHQYYNLKDLCTITNQPVVSSTMSSCCFYFLSFWAPFFFSLFGTSDFRGFSIVILSRLI